MTRTNVMASSRPRQAASISRITRRLGVPAAALLLVMSLALPGSAVAAGTGKESTSTYNQEPNKPSTGTSPSKQSSTPSTTPSNEPAPATTTPTTEAKATTLPYTGFDLSWSIAIGLLLMGTGFSIIAVQRRSSGR